MRCNISSEASQVRGVGRWRISSECCRSNSSYVFSFILQFCICFYVLLSSLIIPFFFPPVLSSFLSHWPQHFYNRFISVFFVLLFLLLFLFIPSPFPSLPSFLPSSYSSLSVLLSIPGRRCFILSTVPTTGQQCSSLIITFSDRNLARAKSFLTLALLPSRLPLVYTVAWLLVLASI